MGSSVGGEKHEGKPPTMSENGECRPYGIADGFACQLSDFNQSAYTARTVVSVRTIENLATQQEEVRVCFQLSN